jgi:adenylate cyclase
MVVSPTKAPFHDGAANPLEPPMVSFRSALVLLFLTILLVTAFLVGGAAFLNAHFAVRYLGDHLLNQASQRITQHVSKVLESAMVQGEENANLIEDGFLDPSDRVAMTRFFLGVMESQPSLSYLSFGRADGRYWHVTRGADRELRVQWILPDPAGGIDLIELKPKADGDLEEISRQDGAERTPPSQRPYYRAAVQAGRSTWPETYVFLGTGGRFDIPGITRATPIQDATGELVGVLTADFDLVALSHYLRGIRVGERGYAFLMEYREDGTVRLIAHPRAPEEVRLTGPSPDGRGQEALEVTESEDPQVRMLSGGMPTTWNEVPNAPFSTLFFQSEGEEWLGVFRPLAEPDRPRWVVGIVIPSAEVFGQIQEMNHITLIISLIGVLSVVTLALITSRRLSKPLRYLAEETHEIAGFNLDPKPVVPSRIQEIHRLGEGTEEMKAGLRSFRKYVPAELVRSILASGKEAELGGDRRRITIFFSDVVNFTTIAEALEPELLSELLAEYLGIMTREMVRQGATVDKYIGDAIMAFWGAPHEVKDQAWLACQTALTNQRELTRLRCEWGEAGHPMFQARIGIHTGEAVVGNFGSENRLDYTAIGDSVNLASRLEGLNKVYGTGILLSEDALAEVEGRVVVRRIDRVAVKGRNQGKVIYELVGLPGEVDQRVEEKIVCYEAALEAYFKGKFSEAVLGFRTVLNRDPEDPASLAMLERSQRYLTQPPPDNWGGISTMDSK